jgi:hypothetical protein
MFQTKKLFLIILQNLFIAINCQKINLNYLVGEVNHNIQIVSGEATLTIPVPKLKGLNGLEPTLELMYKSNQYLQNSELGLGWSLNGLSEISRCFRTKAQDGEYSNIKFNASDRFCLDGQMLIAINGIYGSNETEYKTEIDTFSRIVSFSLDEKTVPSYFKVFTKTNLIYTYGSTDDSTLKPIGLNVTNKWLLNQIEDYLGNKIQYFYSKEKNSFYLSFISYANRFINFTYSDRMDKQTRYYDSKIDTAIDKILSGIILFAKEPNTITEKLTEIERLTLEYQAYGPANLSILKKVNKCYPDFKCLKPLVFHYESEASVNESFANILYKHNVCGAYTNSVCELRQMVDMNGDGKLDILAFGYEAVYVSLNRDSYFEEAKIWSGEFTQSTGWMSSKHYRYIVDINNDGLPDIVGFGDNGVYVALNQYTHIKSMERWHDQFGSSVASGSWTTYRFLGDINNDGYLDIIAFNTSGIVVAYSDCGQKFSNSFLWLTGAFLSSAGWGTTNPIFINDFDSDGYLDLNGFGKVNDYHTTSKAWNRTITATSLITGFSNSSSLNLATLSFSADKNTQLFADMNGDGLPDIFRIDDSNRVIVGISVPNTQSIDKYAFNLSIWTTFNRKTINRYQTLADVNNDGFPDLLIFDCDGIYVLLNNGNLGFDTPKLWNSEIKLCDLANSSKAVLDVDNDGLPDVIEFYTHVDVKIAFNTNKKPRLVKLIDSLDNVKEIQYDSLSNTLYDFNTSTNNAEYRTTGLNPDVVRFYSNSNGIGSKSTIEYNYGPYTCSRLQGRNACAFSSIKYKNLDSPIYFIDGYFFEYPLTGLVKSKKTFMKNTLISEKYYNYNVKKSKLLSFTPNTWIHQVSLSNNTNKHFDYTGSFLKSESNIYSYDLIGNIFSQTENITDNKFNFSKITLFEYNYSIENLKNWFLNQLESKQETFITQYEDGSIESKSLIQMFLYDSDRRLLLKSEKNGLEQSFVYDQFGNIIALHSKDISTLEVRTKRYLYDRNGINVSLKIALIFFLQLLNRSGLLDILKKVNSFSLMIYHTVRFNELSRMQFTLENYNLLLKLRKT